MTLERKFDCWCLIKNYEDNLRIRANDCLNSAGFLGSAYASAWTRFKKTLDLKSEREEALKELCFSALSVVCVGKLAWASTKLQKAWDQRPLYNVLCNALEDSVQQSVEHVFQINWRHLVGNRRIDQLPSAATIPLPQHYSARIKAGIRNQYSNAIRELMRYRSNLRAIKPVMVNSAYLATLNSDLNAYWNSMELQPSKFDVEKMAKRLELEIWSKWLLSKAWEYEKTVEVPMAEPSGMVHYATTTVKDSPGQDVEARLLYLADQLGDVELRTFEGMNHWWYDPDMKKVTAWAERRKELVKDVRLLPVWNYEGLDTFVPQTSGR